MGYAAELAITAQPVDVTAAAGDTVSFTVAAAGGAAPYTYEWTNDDGTPRGTGSTCGAYKSDRTSMLHCTVTDTAGQTVSDACALLF